MKTKIRAGPDALCLTPTKAAQLLSVGRTKMYELLRNGEIPSVRVGRKILIPTAELEAWLHKASTSPHHKGGGDADG